MLGLKKMIRNSSNNNDDNDDNDNNDNIDIDIDNKKEIGKLPYFFVLFNFYSKRKEKRIS